MVESPVVFMCGRGAFWEFLFRGGNVRLLRRFRTSPQLCFFFRRADESETGLYPSRLLVREAYADGYTGISGIKETNNREYRILFIGNSYTYFNNLGDIFALAANGEGYSVEIDHITQGGYSLKQMADPRDPFGAEVEKALAGEKYDAVFLQEQSLLPATILPPFMTACGRLPKK